MSKPETKLVCAVCGARLRYHRIDDGEAVVEITETGEVEELISGSNGSTTVTCSADLSHEVSPEQWDDIVIIAEDAGY